MKMVTFVKCQPHPTSFEIRAKRKRRTKFLLVQMLVEKGNGKE
jgi:hypothetical protein